LSQRSGIVARVRHGIVAVLPGLAFAVAVGIPLGGCQPHQTWHATDVSGALPALRLSMMRTRDSRAVSEADYRGKVTLLYFGYTHCPDVCPLTLSNVGRVLKQLGPSAKDVRVLFVTVDPNRDRPAVLNRYATAFGPEVDALRGDADQLASLARRYRVAYSVVPRNAEGAYEVTHSSGIYAFDREGNARLLISSLSTGDPDVAGTADDLRTLLR
jgi:protein SCO1/2